MDTGLLDIERRMVNFKNHKGTKFSISLDTTDAEEKKYLDKQVMIPGDQLIDFITWLRKAMTQLQNTYYNKAR
jgi:hypothetical protein